jgi:hypothetical protein
MGFDVVKQDAKFYRDAFKSYDHERCKKQDKHNVDYKSILKDLGKKIYE